MPKRSNRLPLLAILCLALAILCVAAILIWLNFGRANGEGEQQNLGASLDASKNEEEAKTTTMANTTSNKLTTTMATETTNKIEKVEELEEMIEASTSAWTFAEIGSQHSQQHAPVCLEPSMEEGKEECPKPIAAG